MLGEKVQDGQCEPLGWRGGVGGSCESRRFFVGGLEVEAFLAVGRSPRRGFAAPRDMGFEDGAGAEGLRSGEAGFEGMKLDEGIGGGGANGEHQVYGGGDGGG